MKKLLLLILPIIMLSGCSLIGKQQTDPELLIKELSQKENGIIQKDCLIRRFYKDIDKRITNKNCYSTEIKVYPTIEFNFTKFGEIMIDSTKKIEEYVQKQGLRKDTDNISEDSPEDNFGMYFEGYENKDLKCVILGDSSLVDTSKSPNRNYISLEISCSNKLEDQKTLQTKLLETINGGEYPYTPYKQFGGVYVDRNMGDFLHAISVFYGPGGVEMIFKRNGDNFEQIYEGNSGIPCSIVQQYNVPSYVYNKCY